MLPGCSQREAPSSSIEQTLADLALKLLDLQAHCGRGQAHGLGCALHAALARDLGERFQLTKGEMHELSYYLSQRKENVNLSKSASAVSCSCRPSPTPLRRRDEKVRRTRSRGRRHPDKGRQEALCRRRPQIQTDGLLAAR